MTRPIPSRPRDAEATKARLLAAATDEFAEHGFAGGRIDRIAARAGANKRLLYMYFGNKQDVFAAVVVAGVTELNETVPFTATDVPGYCGRVYDFLAEHVAIRRVLAWRDVEGVTPTPQEIGAYRSKLAAVAGEQKAGRLSTAFSPVDFVAICEAIISARLDGTVGLRAVAGADSRSARRRHRAAIVHAVAVLTDPSSG